MHGPHRIPQHVNGDFHWFLRTRFCRVVAQIVIAALLLVDVPVPTDHQAVAEATGSSSSQPRITALSPSCVARGANFKLTLANFDHTRPLTVKVGGVVAVIVSTTTLSATTKKLVVTVPQTAPPGRTTVTVSNTKPQSASKTMRVRQAEICGNGVDDDCNGKVDDRDERGRCPIVNRPPVANAGPDQTRPVGATVRLTACGSSDRDGDRLNLLWSFVSKPAGSTATLNGASTMTPTFVIDKPGVYTVKLTVSDGRGGTATDTVVISTTNSAPMANAGSDQSGQLGTTLTLDGSASSDADGNLLTYQWSLTSKPTGSAATLVNPTAVRPTLTLDKTGDYVVRLIVHDGKTASAPDSVVLSTQNSKPVANAGPDQRGQIGTPLTLDGSGSSDADGDMLTYQWSLISQPPGSSAALSSAINIRPSLTVDKAGTYVVQLIVNDGLVSSEPDTVILSTINSKPVANAGAAQSGPVGTLIRLDGSASSDPDGNPLTYRWSFTSIPSGSTATLQNPTTVGPQFTIDKPGTYVAELIVSDGQLDSDPDTVTLSTQNSQPVANAGPDQTVIVGQSVQLDGSASSDVDGQALTFAWSLTSAPSGSTATVSDPSAVKPTIQLDKPGQYALQLVVNDGTVNSEPDTVILSTQNSQPVANAGPDQTVALNARVVLNGSQSSDADGNPLTYRWTLMTVPSGSTAALDTPSSLSPSFPADKPGSYIVQLIVNDGTVDSDPDTVVISTQNSQPVANAGPNQTVIVGQSVHLDGSQSNDADGSVLTYLWSFTSKPANSTVTLSNPTEPQPTFTPDQAGFYVVQLIVHDGTLSSEPSTVSITANPVVVPNQPPTITSTPVTTATVGQAYSYEVNATDPDASDTLTYSLTTFPTAMTIDATTGVISWTPTANQTGQQNVTVQVSDGNGGTDTQSFSITVSSAPPPNQPPTITSTAVTTATVGQAYNYDVNATDPDAGDTLTYSLTTFPTGMTIAIGTGEISWMPEANQTSAQDVTVQVSDGNGGTATQSFTITVTVVNPNNMPPRAQANSYTIRADQTLTVPAPGVLGNDSDDENDPMTARKLTDPTRGALSFNANGSFSFTPSAATQTCTTPPPAAGISFTEPLGIESNFPNIIAASVRGLAKGDFNQDGFLDLAVTGQPALAGASGRIWLTLGNGDGTFQAPVVLQNFPTDVRPSGILAKDVDGDRKLDLFVAVELARQVLFFKGRGDGTFDVSVPTALTQSPAGLQSADLNGDDQLDLVTLNSFVNTENSVTVLLGNGNGTFQSPVNYLAGTQLSDMALGDVNGDTAPDIVVSSGLASGNLNVLLNTNTGSGAFAAAQPFPVKMSVSSLYLADFNRDTKLDVVLGGALCEWTGPNPSGEGLTGGVSGCMTFIPGTGDGTFSVPLSIPLTRSPFTTIMANRANRGQYGENVAPDVNGDGILDVVFGEGEALGNLLHVRLGTGDGTFTTTAWVASPGPAVGVQPLSVTFLDGVGATGAVMIDDFTGDGVMDIATAHAGGNSPGRVALLPGTTPGQFAAPRIFPVLEPPFTGGSFSGGNVLPPYPMTLGDFTNDGQPELAVLAAFNRVGLMPLAPDGTLGPVATGIFVGSSQPNADKILSADFDRDGNLDVVWTTSGLIVAYGNGAGQFTNPVVIPPPPGTAFFNIELGDFNNDSFPDVAAYTDGPSVPQAIDVYLSTGGSHTFTRVPGSALGDLVTNASPGMVAADFDQDGVLDVVLSHGSAQANQTVNVQRSLYLRGNGDGSFQPAVVIASGIGGGFVDYATADVNHDDKLDLIGIAVFSAVHVQLGNGDGTFQAPVLYNAYTPGSFGTLGQVVLADFDWDGHLDVALTTPGTRLSVLRGLGDGTFTAAQKFAAGFLERTDSSLLVADVNTDGRPDLIVGGRSFYAQDFTVLLNNSATLGACVYRDSFTYTASDGSLDSPPVTVRITIQPVNHPPVIISAPVTNANTGQLYTYDVNAIDQDVGERLSYALVTAPSGMTIDPATGVIQWLPAANQAGANSVKVRVYDASGVFAEQTFTLTVTQRVTVPNVVGQTQAAAQTTITSVGLTVGAITSRYSPTIPAGTVISQSPLAGVSVAQNSAVSLVVSLGPLVVPGLTSITVLPSNPVVLVSGTQAFTATGVLSGGGTVDVSEGVTWASGTIAVATINSFGVATGVAAGTSTIIATLDTISGGTTLNVRARVTGDTTLPIAAITTPADGAEVTSPIDVIGTATDANFFRYELSYAVAGETSFTLLSSGSSPVTNGVLGQFDPTLLINDLYDLKLTVFDLGGNEASATVTVQVNRELKVGLFTITFQDLNIPLSGIPITINRTYDSRDKDKGDFGIGWRLDIQTLRIRPNREQGSGWVANLTPGIGGTNVYSLAPVGQHKMSLSLPGGKVEEFDMVVNPAVSALVPIQTTTASYIPRAGTLGSLISRSDNDLLVVGNQPGDITLTTFSGDTYNPKLFTYITADGTMIDIDRTKGVEKVRDLNGNTLTFGPTGIIHSSGKSVTFTRDAQGRITQITDPSGNSRSYTYNASGDLITANDFVGNATRFTYNSTHGLLDINDPTGARVARNEYDASGRLIATIDAQGNRIEFTHNINTQQELVRDRLGNITFLAYDDVGNVVSKTDALGGLTTYTHDSRGNQLTETDPLGRVATKTYDNANNVLTSTDFDGNTTTKTYNARQQVLTTRDPDGRTTTNVYDANGNLTQETNPEGGVTKHTYNAAGNRLTTTDPLGNVTTAVYDNNGNKTSETDPLGTVTSFTYNANGSVLSETKAGQVTQFEYDSAQRRIRTTDALGQQTVTTYSAIGDGSKPASVTDGRGQVTGHTYDTRGNRTSTTFPDGSADSTSYDAENRALSKTDSDGDMTSFQYDALGRQIRITHADGTVNTGTYDAVGRVVTQTNGRGHVTTISYAPNKQTVTDALGNVTLSEFDSQQHPVKVTDALGHVTTLAYDSKGNLIRTTFPDGSTKTTTYDLAGRKTAETDQAGRTTQLSYDGAGHLTQVTDAAGGLTTYRYGTLCCKPVEQTNANGHTMRLTYDLLERLTTRIRPLGQQEAFTYDANGNQLSHTDFNGQITTFTYSPVNRLISKTLPGGSVVSYAFSGSGLRTHAGGDSYIYNARGRLLQETKASGGVLSYTYDAAGNKTSLTTPQGTITYTYDALNRLATVVDSAGTTTYTYDAVGNLTGTAYPNGNTTTYTYDGLNRLTQMTNSGSAGLISSYTYTLGTAGNRLQVVESGPATTGRIVSYTYDAVYRLTQETTDEPGTANDQTITYSYDGVGNRTQMNRAGVVTTYAYDSNDRLLTETTGGNTTTSTYDANGNLKSRTAGTTTDTYTYDGENRLISTAVQSGANPGTVSYTYDADGMRTSKTAGGVTTAFLLDKNVKYAQVVVETTGATIATYTYGNQLISQTRTGDGTHFYLTDGQLSTRQLTTTAGLVSDTHTYDAFGVTLASTGTTQNVYLYTGEQFDPNMGFYYLRARYYNQGTGRFITTDPLQGNIFDPVSLHRYLYANGDPVNKADPSGELVIETLAVIGFIAGIINFIAATAGLAIAFSAKIKQKAAVFGGTRDFRLRLCNGIQAGFGFGGGYQAAIIAEVATRNNPRPNAARYGLWFKGFTEGIGIPTAGTTSFRSRVNTTVEGFYGVGTFRSGAIFSGFSSSELTLPDGTEIPPENLKWSIPIGTQSFLNVGVFRVFWAHQDSDRGYATDSALYCIKQYSSFGQ